MPKQIVINVAVTTLVSVLTCLAYTKYFRRCDDSPDVGDELRGLVREWRAAAAGYGREAQARGEGEAVTAVYGAYGLAFDICALRLEAVIERAEAGRAKASASGSEQSLPEPVRRVEDAKPPQPPPPPSADTWPSG